MRIHTSLFATVALVSLTLVPLAAHAAGTSEVSTSGKGIVGGTLLGAEVVLAAEAASLQRCFTAAEAGRARLEFANRA